MIKQQKRPTHTLCRARAQIGQILLGIMKELRENDALELMRQKLALGSAAVGSDRQEEAK